MSTQTRKERERAERRQRIIETARELAEAHGWEAVTVRRLAERIEYSQPVLYSHFAGKSAIVSAVAEQGFTEFTTVVRQAHAKATDDADRLRRVARAYLEFAAANPALYDAMFLKSTDLTFGLGARRPLREAFGELEAMFRPLVEESDLGPRTEVAWSTLHGLATLERGGRLRPELCDQRSDLLVAEWLAAVGAA
ncbi:MULTISPECIES: TetR/AcrR family transcriptional regulator [Nocardia]|uniref:TetR/AcrR family transcriptional regulator n=1 Tax=Nocardia abscessus TaxID=120957 RepID=UPI001895F1B2|nr:TetR/AcrR family transcriptional regulator [Nocardia abscessus]MBF6471404.1 TetR/AcrR family transcriptional regulator [Nocardia abscessus]